jgi:multiple sugar transport system ATP-binding protein
MGMASVEFRNVTKRWGDFRAVDALDLSVTDREFLVLLGPSGAARPRRCG